MCRVYLFPVAGGYLRRLEQNPVCLTSRDAYRGVSSIQPDLKARVAEAVFHGPRKGQEPAPAESEIAATIPGFVPLGTTMIECGETPPDISAPAFGRVQWLRRHENA